MLSGLTKVKTDALKVLLRAVHRGEVSCPLSVQELTRIGLQFNAEPLMHHLRDVEARGVKATLVAVIAERTARRSP